MRILHVSHYHPPETHGGTQEYVAQLAALQRAAGHDVSVIAGARTPRTGHDVATAVEDGVTVHRVLRDLPGEHASGDLGSERIGALVQRLADEIAPDVVHVHHWHALTSDLVRRLAGRGRPVVLTLHDLFTSCARFFRMPDARRFCSPAVTFADCARCLAPDLGGLAPAAAEALVARRFAGLQAELAAADRVLTVSGRQRDLLLSLPGFAFGDLHPLPIGILDPGPPPPPPPLQPGRLRLVSWAGLDPRKGSHVLLAAVAASRDPHAYEVHLFGRPGEPDYMEELTGLARGLDVRFHGEFADGQRGTFARRFDLAVFPFLAFETYGLVVDEALRTGLPVIVSSHGAPPERLGGRGLACAPEPAALAEQLDALRTDPARLAAMRRAPHGARDLAEHHAALLTLYGELLRRRG